MVYSKGSKPRKTKYLSVKSCSIRKLLSTVSQQPIQHQGQSSKERPETGAAAEGHEYKEEVTAGPSLASNEGFKCFFSFQM
jgi:hypothetical protein